MRIRSYNAHHPVPQDINAHIFIVSTIMRILGGSEVPAPLLDGDGRHRRRPLAVPAIATRRTLR
jgi:hypothetical protein